MEFNRLLSQAISFYGEPNQDNSSQLILIQTKVSKIDTNLYKKTLNEKES